MSRLFLILNLLTVCYCFKSELGHDSVREERLFALIRFSPTLCQPSPTTFGSCTTSKICTDRAGQNIGSCARGFGVCCVFTTSCTPTTSLINIRDHVTIIESMGDTTACTFEFPRLEGHCQLQVDFLDFNLDPPAQATGVCTERLIITGSVTVNNFPICGPNQNQRIFLTYGRSERITLAFNTQSRSRYRLRVTHIPCNSDRLAPAHCLQNYLTTQDIVKSFSYGMGMISGQSYTVCVQDVQGSSSMIEWTECTDVEGTTGLRSQFLLNNAFLPKALGVPPTNGLMRVTGPACDLLTYVEVFGETKHCGAKFTVGSAPSGQIPVHSIAKPYQLFVHTLIDKLTKVPTTQTHIVFPYPQDTSTPVPMPTCAEVGGVTIFAQGLMGTCVSTLTTHLTCTCQLLADLSVIDPTMPVRSGFCLKYLLN